MPAEKPGEHRGDRVGGTGSGKRVTKDRVSNGRTPVAHVKSGEKKKEGEKLVPFERNKLITKKKKGKNGENKQKTKTIKIIKHRNRKHGLSKSR